MTDNRSFLNLSIEASADFCIGLVHFLYLEAHFLHVCVLCVLCLNICEKNRWSLKLYNIELLLINAYYIE